MAKPCHMWLNDGVSMPEVARRLQVSNSVIQQLQEQFHATGNATEHPRYGRPGCTSRQDDRFLRISSMRERMIISTMLRCQLMNVVHVNVNASTIGSRLDEAARA